MTTRTLIGQDERQRYYEVRNDLGEVIGTEAEDIPTPQQVVELTLRDRLTERIGDLGELIAYPALPSAAGLQPVVDFPDVAAVPAGTLTTAQLSTIVRALRDEVQSNRAGVKLVAQYVMGLRDQDQLTRAGAQQVASALRDLARLVRGDFGELD